MDLKEYEGFARVQGFKVMASNPAMNAGVRENDVIVAVNGERFENFKEAVKLMKRAESTVILTMRRGMVQA